MRRFENIDVLMALEAIMKQNTAFYQSDFAYDIEMLKNAVNGKNPNGKHFVWMSRPAGTYCHPERLVLMNNMPAHITWIYFADQEAEKILAYAIELLREDGDHVYGNLYELDFGKYVEHIKAVSLPATVAITKTVDGTERILSFTDSVKYENQSSHYYYDVENPKCLQHLLEQEHITRKRESKPANFTEYIDELRKARIYEEATRIVDAFSSRIGLESLNESYFAVEISHGFALLADGTDMDCLLSALPYRKKQLSSTANGCRHLYAYIANSEKCSNSAKRNKCPNS